MENEDKRQKLLKTWWWISVFLIFLLVFATNEKIYYIFALIARALGHHGITVQPDPVREKALFLREIITPIKGLIFLFSMAGLVRPLSADLLAHKQQNGAAASVNFRDTILIFAALCALVLPTGLYGGSLEYADQSAVVFEKSTSVWSFQRFLMPATAYTLFFRGQVFFLVFSLLCTVGLIYLVQLWFRKNDIELKNWQLISILTSSFIASRLQFPGNPDVLVHSFLLIPFIFPLSELAELSLLALALTSHEASIITFSVIAFFFKERKLALKYFQVIFLYVLIWLVSVKFNPGSLLATQQIRQFSPLASIIADPSRELLGIFFSFKLLWVLIFIPLILQLKRREYAPFFQTLTLVGSGLVMTLIGVDTVRLFGWTFYGLFISIKYLVEQKNVRLQKAMNVILALNLLILPLYVDLNGTIVPAGLYGLLLSVLGRIGVYLK